MIPGSAMRRLEAMTGLRVYQDAVGNYTLEVSQSEYIASEIRDEKTACEELRQMNLRRVCHIVFAKQEWKCAECKNVRPLQGHHVKFRSRWRRQDGPLDVEWNIRGLCQECHGKEHE